jgi:NAD-dependent deacetylase
MHTLRHNCATSLGDLLARARRILVLTGAGISTASGIPDFRGPGGVWTKRRPVYYDAFMSSEDARIEYWDFKLESRAVYQNAQPNAVHHVIVALERAGKIAAVVTQNVDGLHRRAGTSLERLVEVHGTDLLVECQRCHELTDPSPHFEAFARTRTPPACACGGLLKPATISFGQQLSPATLERAAAAALEADLVVALGSTLSVYPAASIPLLAAERGVPYAIVNRGPTDHDGHPAVTLRLEGDVVEIVPPAVRAALALE